MLTILLILGEFYTLGYDSPWVSGDKRRNEVWITKKMQKESFGSSNTKNTNSQYVNADDLTEMLEYNMIEEGDVRHN